MLNTDIAAVIDTILKNSNDKDKPDRILKACEIQMLMLIADNLKEMNENLKKVEVNVSGLVKKNKLGPIRW